jgi:molybdopterin converting factor small subunit
MQVTVHYFAQLRRAAGCASEPIAIEYGMTLRALLDRLADRHGGLFQNLLLGNQDGPHSSLLLFVGDHAMELAHVLRDGDSVTMLTPMAGG